MLLDSQIPSLYNQAKSFFILRVRLLTRSLNKIIASHLKPFLELLVQNLGSNLQMAWQKGKCSYLSYNKSQPFLGTITSIEPSQTTFLLVGWFGALASIQAGLGFWSCGYSWSCHRLTLFYG